MRILIYGINFHPELVGVGKYTGEMAEWLACRGHQVRVVTAPPFNPAWRVASGYSAYRYSQTTHHCVQDTSPVAAGMGAEEKTVGFGRHGSTSSWEGVAARSPVLVEEAGDYDQIGQSDSFTVFRCPVWVPQKPSAAKRLLHLASFACSSSWTMLRQLAWQPDVILTIEPTLFCAPTAWLSARRCGAKSWLHVQDFEVDAAFELKLLGSEVLRRLVESLERRCMAGFDRISTISEKMLMRLEQKGTGRTRCVFFPNWVNTALIFPLQRPSLLRQELGISADTIIALYSGNMAHKQGLDVLAEAARELRYREGLRFVFCGNGPARQGLCTLARGLENVQFLPLQPPERLNELLNLADIHLLPQRADAADVVMPSKLTGMLASGRPVIATAQSGTELSAVVSGKGLVVLPGDVPSLVCAIDQLASDSGLRETLGRNARAYAISNLEKERVLGRFEQELLGLATSTAAVELGPNGVRAME